MYTLRHFINSSIMMKCLKCMKSRAFSVSVVLQHCLQKLVGGFNSFNPFEKICSSNWIISPGRGEINRYLKTPPSSTSPSKSDLKSVVPLCWTNVFRRGTAVAGSKDVRVNDTTYWRVCKKVVPRWLNHPFNEYLSQIGSFPK